MDEVSTFEFTGKVWLWRPAKPSGTGWYFLTVEGQSAAEIRYAALGRTGGFGSARRLAIQAGKHRFSRTGSRVACSCR
jgi:hypothetical protein